MASATWRGGRIGPGRWFAAGMLGLLAAVPARSDGTNIRYPHPVGKLQPYSYHGYFPTSWQSYVRCAPPPWADPAAVSPREAPQQPPGPAQREVLPPPAVGPVVPMVGVPFRPGAPLVPPYDITFPERR